MKKSLLEAVEQRAGTQTKSYFVSFRLPEKLSKEFDETCDKFKLNKSGVVRELVTQFVAEARETDQ